LIQSVKINKNIGTSTAVLLKLEGDELITTNLGDSGYMIFRPTKKAGLI